MIQDGHVVHTNAGWFTGISAVGREQFTNKVYEAHFYTLKEEAKEAAASVHGEIRRARLIVEDYSV